MLIVVLLFTILSKDIKNTTVYTYKDIFKTLSNLQTSNFNTQKYTIVLHKYIYTVCSINL